MSFNTIESVWFDERVRLKRLEIEDCKELEKFDSKLETRINEEGKKIKILQGKSLQDFIKHYNFKVTMDLKVKKVWYLNCLLVDDWWKVTSFKIDESGSITDVTLKLWEYQREPLIRVKQNFVTLKAKPYLALTMLTNSKKHIILDKGFYVINNEVKERIPIGFFAPKNNKKKYSPSNPDSIIAFSLEKVDGLYEGALELQQVSDTKYEVRHLSPYVFNSKAGANVFPISQSHVIDMDEIVKIK